MHGGTWLREGCSPCSPDMAPALRLGHSSALLKNQNGQGKLEKAEGGSAKLSMCAVGHSQGHKFTKSSAMILWHQCYLFMALCVSPFPLLSTDLEKSQFISGQWVWQQLLPFFWLSDMCPAAEGGEDSGGRSCTVQQHHRGAGGFRPVAEGWGVGKPFCRTTCKGWHQRGWGK